MLRMHNMYVLHSHAFIQICAIYIYMHGSQYAHLRWGFLRFVVTICQKTLPVLVAKHSTIGEAITAWHEA